MTVDRGNRLTLARHLLVRYSPPKTPLRVSPPTPERKTHEREILERSLVDRLHTSTGETGSQSSKLFPVSL